MPRLEQVPIDVPYGDGRAYMPPGEAFLDRVRLALHEDALLALETDNGLALSRAYATAPPAHSYALSQPPPCATCADIPDG